MKPFALVTLLALSVGLVGCEEECTFQSVEATEHEFQGELSVDGWTFREGRVSAIECPVGFCLQLTPDWDAYPDNDFTIMLEVPARPGTYPLGRGNATFESKRSYNRALFGSVQVVEAYRHRCDGRRCVDFVANVAIEGNEPSTVSAISIAGNVHVVFRAVIDDEAPCGSSLGIFNLH